MFGTLVASLDDPRIAADIVAALDDPGLAARLATAADDAGRAPSEVIASTVRRFLDTASDDHWLQLVGIMNRAADPGLAAVRAILAKALPEPLP
jgi:hypothetical protein